MLQTVVWDPEGKLLDRTTFDDARHARAVTQARARGVVFLPELAESANPVEGVFVRHWGRGAVFDTLAPRRVCPMLNYVTPQMTKLHWVARLMPLELDERHLPKQGILRIAAYPGQRGTISGGIAAGHEGVDTMQIGSRDAFGGWTVGGEANISTTMEGYLATSLYGACSGFRVMWSAVSVT